MSDILYQRRVRVQIGSIVVLHDGDDSLRIKFHVAKNPNATEANKASVEIFNLADARRELIDTLLSTGLPLRVMIDAGYAHSTTPGIGTVFSGRLQSVVHTRDRGDWGTKIIAASNASDVPVAATYEGPGLSVGAIAGDLLKKIGTAARDIDITAATQSALSGDLAGIEAQLNKAFSVSGMGMDVLERLVQPHGFQVSEQDGKILLLKAGEKVGAAVVLNADSGLIGTISPMTDSRRSGSVMIRARSLLRHDLAIGTAVRLDSRVQRGLFVIERVDHDADTHGGGGAFATAFVGRGIRG